MAHLAWHWGCKTDGIVRPRQSTRTSTGHQLISRCWKARPLFCKIRRLELEWTERRTTDTTTRHVRKNSSHHRTTHLKSTQGNRVVLPSRNPSWERTPTNSSNKVMENVPRTTHTEKRPSPWVISKFVQDPIENTSKKKRSFPYQDCLEVWVCDFCFRFRCLERWLSCFADCPWIYELVSCSFWSYETSTGEAVFWERFPILHFWEPRQDFVVGHSSVYCCICSQICAAPARGRCCISRSSDFDCFLRYSPTCLQHFQHLKWMVVLVMSKSISLSLTLTVVMRSSSTIARPVLTGNTHQALNCQTESSDTTSLCTFCLQRQSRWYF